MSWNYRIGPSTLVFHSEYIHHHRGEVKCKLLTSLTIRINTVDDKDTSRSIEQIQESTPPAWIAILFKAPSITPRQIRHPPSGRATSSSRREKTNLQQDSLFSAEKKRILAQGSSWKKTPA
ncbi:hypothetical protein KM043_014875 [Ampulex compressa]|nr:hypothetical protein KM043_014875 [Ampulex compressa]